MQFDFGLLSKLARLGIDNQQQKALAADLEEILGFVKVLEEVQVPGEAALEGVVTDLVNRTQPDVLQHPWPVDIAQTLLGQAPATKEGYLVVEKVIEH